MRVKLWQVPENFINKFSIHEVKLSAWWDWYICSYEYIKIREKRSESQKDREWNLFKSTGLNFYAETSINHLISSPSRYRSIAWQDDWSSDWNVFNGRLLPNICTRIKEIYIKSEFRGWKWFFLNFIFLNFWR